MLTSLKAIFEYCCLKGLQEKNKTKGRRKMTIELCVWITASNVILVVFFNNIVSFHSGYYFCSVSLVAKHKEPSSTHRRHWQLEPLSISKYFFLNKIHLFVLLTRTFFLFFKIGLRFGFDKNLWSVVFVRQYFCWETSISTEMGNRPSLVCGTKMVLADCCSFSSLTHANICSDSPLFCTIVFVIICFQPLHFGGAESMTE